MGKDKAYRTLQGDLMLNLDTLVAGGSVTLKDVIQQAMEIDKNAPRDEVPGESPLEGLMRWIQGE